ncbi:2-keto-3-deoxygluconate permease [Clostridium tarantellae]|uniref:2-keto-3-deoxygluconate permease n=1 Tax=Clostridium tarantellae TaxID=39493 RepID=A0A6I1MQZ5_9CLOT|nr:2-keto-3-deoxygluconate permease [Clostridium tarantellae]MPQ45213.1 2-keto-3-deoxygluconate permease [Clostridium tarantellae]
MQIPILKTMKKVPGGMMVVPLLLGALINTFFPHCLEIGGFTTALFKKGAVPLIGLFLFCMGSQIKANKAGLPVVKGFVSLISKFIVGLIITLTVGHFFGAAGIFGLTPMVLMAAFGSANTGLYVSLADQYGNEDDVAAGAIVALSGGAFFTMLALGVSGLANIPIMSMVAVILPVIIGFILGNLDEDFRKFLKAGQHVLTPFFSFALGAGMNFHALIDSGVSGITLGIAVTLITGFVNYFIHGLLWEKKAVNFAVGTTAGNQLATPLAVVAADASLTPFLTSATAQIATSILITAILCPFIVGYVDKRLKIKKSTKNNAQIKAA